MLSNGITNTANYFVVLLNYSNYLSMSEMKFNFSTFLNYLKDIDVVYVLTSY